MSGRAAAWMDRDQQRKDSYQHILDEKSESINVYRHTGNQTNTGFRNEAGAPTLVDTIMVRLDKAKQTQPTDTQDSTAEQSQLVALTDSTNVYLGDIWQNYDLGGQRRFYKVVKTMPIEIGFQVWVKEVRKLRWPLGD